MHDNLHTSPASVIAEIEAERPRMDTSRPMKPDRIEAFMKCFESAEERGDWYCVALWLESEVFDWIRKFADEELLQRIAVWEDKLAQARAYEEVHGKGSLYVKDHPTNIALKKVAREIIGKYSQKAASISAEGPREATA